MAEIENKFKVGDLVQDSTLLHAPVMRVTKEYDPAAGHHDVTCQWFSNGGRYNQATFREADLKRADRRIQETDAETTAKLISDCYANGCSEEEVRAAIFDVRSEQALRALLVRERRNPNTVVHDRGTGKSLPLSQQSCGCKECSAPEPRYEGFEELDWSEFIAKEEARRTCEHGIWLDGNFKCASCRQAELGEIDPIEGKE